MASDLGRTILVTLDDEPADTRPVRVKLAAFLPIVVAMVGVAIVLLGGVSVGTTSVATNQAVDTMTTGSIAPAQ